MNDRSTRLPQAGAPRRPRRALRRDRAGSVSVEFALVCLPFLLFLLGLLEVGYDLYAQLSLDYAVHLAARKVEVGATQGSTVATAALFETNYLCPALGKLIACPGSISVNVKPVTSDFFTNSGNTIPLDSHGNLSTSGYAVCPGQPNQLMLVTALYAGPSIIGLLIPDMSTPTGSGYAHVTMSSAAFINESFPVTASPPTGC